MKYVRKNLPIKIIMRRDGILQAYHVQLEVAEHSGETTKKEKQKQEAINRKRKLQDKQKDIQNDLLVEAGSIQKINQNKFNRAFLIIVRAEAPDMAKRAMIDEKDLDRHTAHRQHTVSIQLRDIEDYARSIQAELETRKNKGEDTFDLEKLLESLNQAIETFKKDFKPDDKIADVYVISPLSRDLANERNSNKGLISIKHEELQGGLQPEERPFLESAFMTFIRWKHGGIDDANVKVLAMLALHSYTQYTVGLAPHAIVTPPVTRPINERKSHQSPLDVDSASKQNMNKRIHIRAASIIANEVVRSIDLTQLDKVIDNLPNKEKDFNHHDIQSFLRRAANILETRGLRNLNELKSEYKRLRNEMEDGRIDKEILAHRLDKLTTMLLKSGLISEEQHKHITTAEPGEKDVLTYRPIRYDPLLLGVKNFEVKYIKGGDSGGRTAAKFSVVYDKMKKHLTRLLEDKYQVKINSLTSFYNFLSKHIKETLGYDVKNIMLFDDNVDTGATQAVLAHFLKRAGFNVTSVTIYNMNSAFKRVKVSPEVAREIRQIFPFKKTGNITSEREAAKASGNIGKALYNKLKPKRVNKNTATTKRLRPSNQRRS